ncbi:hypothetical protein Aab01nite_40590 [Paractinoplanes abujensis]|uniref:Cell division protein FtsL n=1 Tax=Paractinoplanes abujensis TaxID=882441 RepID=A0A7W7CTA4_9ACTN|nr:hypothetical protein [Actinoplanes abujensis]MBB4694317.1 hypothetical protein [Actinoplanes abujensis]GID20469.1 hypothetical protein Aab01nite_40590 [Actinoplanes abujensis]
MSERTYAPRSGGRTADEQRPATGRRQPGSSRDADAPGSAGRGARQFAGAEDGGARRSDTRRSGTRSKEEKRTPAEARRERDERRATRDDRPGRDTRTGRDERTSRDERAGRTTREPVARAKTRTTEGARAKTRTTEGVRPKTRNTDAVRAKTRTAEGARGRRVEAPVDGAAALQLEVTAAEPLRTTGEVPAAPRLRVAPPPPIHGGPRAPFVAGVIGVVIVGVLGILLINTKTNENSFRIADLQKQNTALENQRQDLDNQLVEASSIGNLDAAARRLGLVRADIREVAKLRLPDGKIIQVPKPVQGQPSITQPDAATDKGGGNISPADGTGR